MPVRDVLQLAATIVRAILTVLKRYRARQLQGEFRRLSVGLDQSILLLHHAREVAIGMVKADIHSGC